MQNNGNLVISLDFELLWGVFDKVDPAEKKEYFLNTRNVIPEILQIFSDYEIHATWAIVGMLFNTGWEEWQKNVPGILPSYHNPSLSAYNFVKSVKADEIEFGCFANDLIEKIHITPNQEIATHTYSHYYCLEKGQSVSSFKADLKKSIELAINMGIQIKSLVFPRNQFNTDYLSVCYELGIENVRSNPTDWYWKDTQIPALNKKIFRTGDAYIGINNKSYKLETIGIQENFPVTQKASRFLRPFSDIKVLDKMRLQRIKSEMTYAAKKNEVYHLWWHPHNFGNNPKQNISDLKDLLENYKKCNRDFNFKSLNMKELGTLLKIE